MAAKSHCGLIKHNLSILHCVSIKTVPPYIRSQVWQILTDFRYLFTVAFSTILATKPCHIFQHILKVLFRYLAKHKRPKLAKFCCTKRNNSCNIWLNYKCLELYWCITKSLKVQLLVHNEIWKLRTRWPRFDCAHYTSRALWGPVRRLVEGPATAPFFQQTRFYKYFFVYRELNLSLVNSMDPGSPSWCPSLQLRSTNYENPLVHTLNGPINRINKRSNNNDTCP